MGLGAAFGRIWGALRRSVFLALGLACVGLGVIGLFVPLMPSTTFFVIAAVLFARSSPRFRAMILNHPRVGPPVRNFLAHRVIPLYAKWAAGGMLALSLAVLIATGAGPVAIGVAAAVAIGVMAYVLPKPIRLPEPAPR